MQQLEEIVDYYLTSNTNYALMITGEWGVGKTYYFKNILSNKIKDTSTTEDNSKKYKPILVSLFGLKNLEDLQAEIFLSLYPILNNKKVKLGASILKALTKGMMHLKNLGEFFNYASDFEIDKGELVKFSDLVICFDDLERLSENLKFEEFVGYVNSLVENENVKILIIANENKIERNNYFALKEKVIGNSIEFIPDFNKSFDSLIEIKFGGFKLFKDFLNENKASILEYFTKNSNNLRILSFALSYFQRVFSEVNNQISSFEILNSKKEEILLSTLKFTLAISIEYKEGRISFKKKEDLYIAKLDWSSISLDDIKFDNSNNQKKEEDKTYREKFIERYYFDDTFTFYSSIFNFITGGSTFHLKELIFELNILYHIEDNIISPHYEIFNLLASNEVFNLSDTEYKRHLRQLLKYTDKGLFSINDYMSIFILSIKFNNPLNLNMTKLEKRIIAGMKKGRESYKYQDSLDFYLTVFDNKPFKETLLRIRQSALEINNDIKSSSDLIDYQRLEKSCYENFTNFYNEVLNPDSQYFFIPIFKIFNANQFYLYFLKSNGKKKLEIIHFFNSRYRDHPHHELKQEIHFLETLLNKLTKKLKRLPPRNKTHFLFQDYANNIQISIDKLNRTTY